LVNKTKMMVPVNPALEYCTSRGRLKLNVHFPRIVLKIIFLPDIYSVFFEFNWYLSVNFCGRDLIISYVMWSYQVTYLEYVEDSWLTYIHMRKLPAF
jgi:hypothetical protein